VILLRMKITEDKPADVTVRAWRSILRGCHEAQGRYWQREILPRHFAPYARFKYGYQQRTQRYLAYKLKTGRGMVDLVYSGGMQEYLTSTGIVRGFPSRATITMTGPRYVTPNPVGRRPNAPNLAKEVLSVAADERTELAQVLEQDFTRRLAQWRETRTTVID
jgi:hypothetical protein